MVCLEYVPYNVKLRVKRGAAYIGGCVHACHGRGNAAADKTVVHGRGGHGRGRRGRRGGRRGGRGGRTVHASSDSDGDEERDTAELDSAIAVGGLEEVCRQTEQSRRGMSLALALQMMMIHQQMMGVMMTMELMWGSSQQLRNV
eukprot:364833-Chlamydomonas_euryale.AAC.24